MRIELRRLPSAGLHRTRTQIEKAVLGSRGVTIRADLERADRRRPRRRLDPHRRPAQLVAGFAAGALVHAFNDEIATGDRSLTGPPLWRGDREDRSDEIESLLSATREEYAAAFADLSGGLEAIAWERRPFLRRPFLRFENGQWMLTSSTSATSSSCSPSSPTAGA